MRQLQVAAFAELAQRHTGLTGRLHTSLNVIHEANVHFVFDAGVCLMAGNLCDMFNKQKALL